MHLKLLDSITRWSIFVCVGEIVNALAVVIVLIFKNEFPERWPSFFSDLGSALLVPRASPDGAASNGANLDIHLVEMYLAVLREIDTEVVSREVHRSNDEHAHNRQLVRWFAISHSIYVISYRFHPLDSVSKHQDICLANFFGILFPAVGHCSDRFSSSHRIFYVLYRKIIWEIQVQ